MKRKCTLLCNKFILYYLYTIMQKTNRYTIYIWLFDKDTKTQLIDTPKAMAMLSEKIANEFGGGTIYPSSGVYKHDDGSIVQEPSIVIQTMADGVDNFVNSIKKEFNQESVLVNKDVVMFSFA